MIISAKRKYIGNIYDGRWRVIRFERYGSQKSQSGRYVLENIFNKNIHCVKDVTMRKIDRGEITVSKLLANEMKRKERKEAYHNWNKRLQNQMI